MFPKIKTNWGCSLGKIEILSTRMSIVANLQLFVGKWQFLAGNSFKPLRRCAGAGPAAWRQLECGHPARNQ